MFRALDFTGPMLPEDRPRYLMGVGRPLDIVGSVLRGVDMFDCVMPTRSGRTGQGFTRHRKHSRGYLHHLFKANEMLGPMLLTWHNLRYYQDLMAGLRVAIEAGNLAEHAAALEAAMADGDIPATSDPLAG
jgi:queuine tRNA-ribosyltransferase